MITIVSIVSSNEGYYSRVTDIIIISTVISASPFVLVRHTSRVHESHIGMQNWIDVSIWDLITAELKWLIFNPKFKAQEKHV